MATRYLKSKVTGAIHIATPILEERDDMEPYTPPKGSALDKRSKVRYGKGKIEFAQPAAQNLRKNKPGEFNDIDDDDESPDDSGDDAGGDEDAPDGTEQLGEIADVVKASTSKDKLEALAREYLGIEIDKRKGLDKLKAEVLKAIEEQ